MAAIESLYRNTVVVWKTAVVAVCGFEDFGELLAVCDIDSGGEGDSAQVFWYWPLLVWSARTVGCADGSSRP